MNVNGKPGFYWVDLTNKERTKLIGEWSGAESIRSFALWQAK